VDLRFCEYYPFGKGHEENKKATTPSINFSRSCSCYGSVLVHSLSLIDKNNIMPDSCELNLGSQLRKENDFNLYLNISIFAALTAG
jgi:hypothetical protein